MLGIDSPIILALGANLLTLIGAYANLVQRLTKLESEQRHVLHTLELLCERRRFDRQTGNENP